MYSIAVKKFPNNQLSVIAYRSTTKRSKRAIECDESSSASQSEGDSEEGDLVQTSAPLSLVSNSEPGVIKSQAQSFRRTSFGKNARTRLFHAGAVCDRIDPVPNNYLFITATLPGDDVWCKWSIAEYAHYLVDRLKSWLSKRQSDRLEFYVWEHQKRAALHLHYCVYVPDASIRAAIKRDFKREWINLLENVGQKVGHSLWGRHAEKSFDEKLAIIRTEVAEVKFSVAKYLAGYVGGKGDKHGKDKYYDFYPKRWWGISRPLSKLIKEHTEEIVHDYASTNQWLTAFEELDHKFEPNSLTRKFYRHKIGQGKTLIFYFTPESHKKICLEKTMKQFYPAKFPNAYVLIQQVSALQRAGRTIVQNCPKLRAALSPQSVACLQDATLIRSLGACTMRLQHLTLLERACTELLSLTQYGERFAGYRKMAVKTQMLISQQYQHLKWDERGWLSLITDLPKPLDNGPENLHHGTISPKG